MPRRIDGSKIERFEAARRASVIGPPVESTAQISCCSQLCHQLGPLQFTQARRIVIRGVRTTLNFSTFEHGEGHSGAK